MKISTCLLLWGCSLLCFALASILGLGYSIGSMKEVGFNDVAGKTTLCIVFGIAGLIIGMIRRGIGQRLTRFRNYAHAGLILAAISITFSAVSLFFSIKGLTDGSGLRTADAITSAVLLASILFVAASSLCLLVAAIYDGFYNGRFAVDHSHLYGTGRRVNSSSYVSFILSLDKYMRRAECIEALVDSSLNEMAEHLEGIRKTDPADYSRIIEMLRSIDWKQMEYLSWSGSAQRVLYRGRA